MLGWNSTTRMISTKMNGIDSIASTIRIMTVSTTPPTNPETAP